IKNLIGSLWWLALVSRPDICLAVHKCATWQNKPSKQLLKHVHHILYYLNSTQHYGLVFQKSDNLEVTAFCDSNFGTDIDKKSRYGYFFFLGGGLNQLVLLTLNQSYVVHD